MGRGGKRPGAGRHKGTKDPQTLVREAVADRFRQRVFGIADKLFESQLTLAQGQTFLYRIDKQWITPPSGKGGFWKNKKPVIETDPDVIASFLNGEFDSRKEEDNGGASYFFITTKEPQNMALDSMLDRALGSATKSLDVRDPDGVLKNVIIIKSANVKKR